jgi:hypothetical protein
MNTSLATGREWIQSIDAFSIPLDSVGMVPLDIIPYLFQAYEGYNYNPNEHLTGTWQRMDPDY